MWRRPARGRGAVRVRALPVSIRKSIETYKKLVTYRSHLYMENIWKILDKSIIRGISPYLLLIYLSPTKNNDLYIYLSICLYVLSVCLCFLHANHRIILNAVFTTVFWQTFLNILCSFYLLNIYTEVRQTCAIVAQWACIL